MDRMRQLQQGSFSTNEIAEVAGVTKNVIADWVIRDLISIPKSPGRGNDRTFTVWNAVEATIAGNLNKAGVRSGPLKSIMSQLNREADLSEVSAVKKNNKQNGWVVSIPIDREGNPVDGFSKVDAIVIFQVDVGLAISSVKTLLRR